MKMKSIVLVFLMSLFASGIYAQGVNSLKTSSNALPDGNIEVLFTMNVEDGWYIYSTEKVTGPMPTTFTAEASPDFELVGSLQDAEPAHEKFDNGFKRNIKYFEGKVVFKQIIKPLTDRKFTVRGLLEYQTCNGEECLLNDNEISVTVKPEVVVTEGIRDAESVLAMEVEGEGTSDTSSIWGFLLVAFLAGLGGVITPCVFPMIPMTVGFLLGGSGTSQKGIVKGLIFGLSIILLYTVLGLVVALFQSTTATDVLGTHWIPNLIFAALFLVFAVSFLGAFEITLPNGLANKADKEADKGGYIAAFFVALAMVIVSFSCTGPFVGSILAAAVTDGVALKPILGMAVFGFAFSLPFVLLSFFPGMMKKLPKSGGWLNVVKVVFAFIMLAFAMKFIYNIDAYFGWGIVTRIGFISVWAALALLLGLYFIGVFRTNHDTPIEGVGWGRTVAAVVCFAFMFYLVSGFFGAPLKSISGFIPPQDGSTIVLSSGGSGQNADSSDAVSGYSSLANHTNLDEALRESAATGKPVFVAFKSHTCSVCKVMEATVLSDADVLGVLSEKYVIANLYVDDKTPDSEFKTLGRRYRDYEMKTFGSASQPLYAVIDASGNVLSGPVGSSDKSEFLKFLQL